MSERTPAEEPRIIYPEEKEWLFNLGDGYCVGHSPEYVFRAVNAFEPMRKALEAVEWQGNTNISLSRRAVCPFCRQYRPAGHAPDCQLAAALRDAKGD